MYAKLCNPETKNLAMAARPLHLALLAEPVLQATNTGGEGIPEMIL